MTSHTLLHHGVLQFKFRSRNDPDERDHVMSTKTELLEAHQAMVALLDAKFSHINEWKAFRAIDRALVAELQQVPAEGPGPRSPKQPDTQPLSYVGLTERALQEGGRPISTGPLVEFIGRHRDLGSDLERAKINISTSLSKSAKIKNIPWGGGRAWWYADQPAPKDQTAGSS
jgi:hypothetical protein